MKVLVYGAGVIGTFYAARLQQAGHQVTVLARSPRLEAIQRPGLALEDVVSGARSASESAIERGYRLDVHQPTVVTCLLIVRGWRRSIFLQADFWTT